MPKVIQNRDADQEKRLLSLESEMNTLEGTIGSLAKKVQKLEAANKKKKKKEDPPK